MLEDVLNSIIAKFLGEYIKDIDKKDLKVSMWKGDVKLKNLEVKTEALDFLQLPVDIKSGFIGELDISIPWKDIGRKPTKVNISKIFVVICPRSEIHYDEESYNRRKIEIKRQQLKAIDEKEAKKKKELHEKENNSLVANLINKIIRNFEMSINEIHIRYEDRSSNPKHPFCAGICLEKISISPNIVNKDASDKHSKAIQHNGVFSKDVLIHRFAVYWDSDSKSQVNASNSVSLIEDMELVFSSKAPREDQPKPTSFIVRPLSVAVNVQMDIRGVELRKPTPEQAALSAMKELGWETSVFVNQNFIQTYCMIKKDGVRGRDEKEETELFIEKFKQKYPKFCSSENLEYGKKFSEICWKYANTASPMMVASATLPQLTIEVLQNQIRDVKTLLAALSSQVKRSQYFVNRPTSSIVKKPHKWWKYAIQCVMEENKRNKEACSWNDYLQFKKRRNEYIHLYKRVLHASGYEPIHKDKKALKRKQELEDLFSVENTVLFRKMAQYELEKEQAEMKSYSSDSEDEDIRKELYKELELSKDDMNAWVGGQPKDILFSFDFSLSSTQVILRRETQKIMDLCVENIDLRMYKRKEYLELWASIYDVKVLDTFTAKTRYSSILSIHHTEDGTKVQESNELSTRMTPSTHLLPSDFKHKSSPFVQAHVEIPAMDNTSGMRVEAVVQTMDIVLNVPWLLEVLKFAVPDNIVVMSHYEEKAYNMITALRNGDANLLTVVQNNKGMNIDMLILPINIIIPDSCIAHRSKTNLLCCQIGNIYVDSKPNATTPDLSAIVAADLYNTISVSIQDFAVGVVNGREFASNERTTNCLLAGLDKHLLIKPFAIQIALKMCLINELRWISTDVGIHIEPIILSITQQLVVDMMNWLVVLFQLFSEKQKELDLDVMAFLLQPKQLLFSCIEYDGSPLLCDHDISSWKTSPQKLRKLLYREVMQKQESYKKLANGVFDSSLVKRSMIMGPPQAIEKNHSVVHLTYEDLLLLQYKPMMKIDVAIDKLSLQIKKPNDDANSLLDIDLSDLKVLYQDHFYDMIVNVKLPTFQILDHSVGQEPRVLLQSVHDQKDFIDLEFITVGEMSMLNDFYDAATNLCLVMSPLQCFLNVAIVNSLLDFIPPLPAFPASDSPKEEVPPKKSAHPQDGQLSLQVAMSSIQLDLLTDASQSILHFSMDDCKALFYQGMASTHIVASLHDLGLMDCTQGCGIYPDVLKIQLDNPNTHFLTADIMLVKNAVYSDIQDTTIDIQVQAPVLTVRYRFIQEVLQYLAHGEIAFLMKRLAGPPASETAIVATPAMPTTSSGLHNLVMNAVENLFSSLVASNIIRETPSGYVLPRANVCLHNLVVVVPCTSTSHECVKFELGKIVVNNQEGHEYETVKLLEQNETSSFKSEISMRLEGMNLMTCYQSNEELVSQTLLHDVNVDLSLLLSSILYTKLHLSAIVLSLNQFQLDFLMNHLLNNFTETAVTVYPEEQPRALPEVTAVKSEQPVKEEVVEVKKVYGVGKAVYVDINLESLALELLKEDGGYSQTRTSAIHPSSVCIFECNTCAIHTVLSSTTLSLAFALSQILLKDTRSEVPYRTLLKKPVVIGNECTPAISISLTSADMNKTALDVIVGVRAIQLFPTPLFLELLSLINSFSSAVTPTAVTESEPEPQPQPEPEPEVKESKPFQISPFVGSLLDALRVSITIDPVTIYLADSLTQDSAFIMVNAGVKMNLLVSSALDVALSMHLCDIRVAQCFEDNLLPPRDCNDILQSWNANIQVSLKNVFKAIAVEMADERGLNLSIGYHDIQLLLHALSHFTSTTTTVSEPQSEMVTAPVIPQVQVPFLVPKDSGLDVSVNVNLHPIQVVVVSDFSKVEVPFVQVVLSDVAIQLDLKQELVALVQFQLACDFYNQTRIAWEPIIEPWSLMVQLIQRPVDEKQKDAVGNRMWQNELLPTQTSCVIRSDTLFTANVSVAFCSTALSLLNDFNRATKGEIVTESGYYLYIENQLGVDCEMEVVYDGGMMKHLQTLRKKWNELESRQEILKKEGFVYCIVNGVASLMWVELSTTEPRVCVFHNQVDKEHRVLFCQSLPGTVEPSSNTNGILTCRVMIDQVEKELTLFTTVPSELKKWRDALVLQNTMQSGEDVQEVLSIPTGTCIRTSLPAHPSLVVSSSVESYNQRLITLRLPNCRPVECCCDYEAKLAYSILSSKGEYMYDIVVNIMNKAGRRLIVLSPMMSITNCTSSPIQCRFVTEKEAGEVKGSYIVKQSQKKQVNLVDVNDNFYGTAVSVKSPAFDKETLGFAVRQASSATKEFTSVAPSESLYCSVESALKGRIELKETALNSLNLSDITSLNMRRTVLNVGLNNPHYVLLRCTHSKITSDMLKFIPPVSSKSSKNNVLSKIAEETVDDVYGMVNHQRCIFSMEIVPVLILKNCLPLDMEYKVVMMKNNQMMTIHQGVIESAHSEEIRCINPDILSQYGFLLRPKNTQFVWNQQVLPIQLNTSGQYVLSDMENSQTSLQYEYHNQELVIYSRFWVVNRTNDTLFISGKKESQIVKLPANSVQVDFESNASSLQSQPLHPILFSNKDKKPMIRVRKTNTEWSDAVKMVANQSVKCSIAASLPYNVNNTYYTVTMKRMSEPFDHTFLITICPYYLFVNRTSSYLSIYDQQSLFTVAPYACYYFNSLRSSSQHLLSFTAHAEEQATGAEEKSAEFDCDVTRHYDIVFKDPKSPNLADATLFAVDTAFMQGNQTITVSPMKPESISYCIVNNTCLTSVDILQVSTDLSAAVSIPPLTSQMFVFTNLVNSHEVGLFLHPIHLESKQSDFQTRCLIDMDKIGQVTTFTEENPKRKINIRIEVVNSTNLLIIDEEVITESDTVWKEKKRFEYNAIVIEETLSKCMFEYSSATTEVDNYVAALSDFESHASESISLEGEVIKQPAVIVSKDSDETIDLMLDDSYFYFFIRNVSIRNLQRIPCAIQLRCSNGEEMIETDLVRGSHVFINKEMLFKQRSSEMHMKVFIQFEKKTVEYDVYLPFASLRDINKVQLIQVPFGSLIQKEEGMSMMSFSEDNSLCNGGSIFLYCVHCKNNRINDNQKEYLPHLLYKQFTLQKQIEELWRTQTYIQYEMNTLGFNYHGNHNHTFIEQALHSGLYANRDETPFTDFNSLLETIRSTTMEHTEMKEDSKEIENDKLLRIELDSIYNIPSAYSSYQAFVVCGGKEYLLGESKESLAQEQITTNQMTIQLSNVYTGCKWIMSAGGQYVVSEVEKDSEADKKGVRVGMVLSAINEKIVETSISNMNQHIEALNRPLSLTLVPAYRNSSLQYTSMCWKSALTLPRGSTMDCTTMQLVVKDPSSQVVFSKDLEIQRYNDWCCYVNDASSAITCAMMKTHWINDAVDQRMIDTSVSVFLKGIGISLFSSKPVEVLNAVLEGLNVNFKSFNNNKQMVELSVQNIQVDNQLLSAMEPVLLGVPDRSTSAFTLSCTLPSSTGFMALEDVSLSLSPLAVSLDNHLLVALLQIINDLPLNLLMNAEQSSFYDLPEFRSVFLIPDSMKSSVYIYTNKLVISAINLSVGMKVDPAITTTSIFLPNLSYLLPIQTVLDTLCSLVADIDATKISLTSLQLNNYYASTDALVSRLVSFYVPQATKQVLKIVGSVNLLGNPVGLVEDVSSGIKAIIDPLKEKDLKFTDKEMNKRLEEGGKTLLRNTTKGLFNTASKITGTVGNGVASLTFNKHYKEQRVLGRKGFIHGITSGVTGVVMDPIRGAKKNGLIGAVEGVGIGLIGVVTKPFSGLLDDTSRILNNVKDAASHEVKLERIRTPVCVLCDHVIRKYDEHLALGQLIFHTGTTRYRIEEMKDEQYVFHCCVDQNTHYFVVTQYHCILLNANCDLLWWMPLKNINIEVDEEEMRIISNKESKLVLFNDKDICSRLYGILLNIPNWTSKEVVQCSKEFVNFINMKYSKENEVREIYNQTSVDFKSLDVLSVCMIAVDSRYERKFAGNYSVKSNSYQEYCLEVVGGMEGTAMVSWRVYKRYSELREYYKSIENQMPKELRSVKFPGKKLQILGSHLNSNALQQREEQMQKFVDYCMNAPIVMNLTETKQFLTRDPVNVKYEV